MGERDYKPPTFEVPPTVPPVLAGLAFLFTRCSSSYAHRNCKSLLGGESVFVDSLSHAFVDKSPKLAPLSQSVRDTFNSYISVVSFIVALIFVSCPLYIANAVIPFIVYPVNRVSSARMRIYMLNEGVKTIQAISNFYSSTSVVLIRFVRSVITPLHHVRPSSIFPSWFCKRMSMYDFFLGKCFTHLATTARLRTPHQVVDANRFCNTTNALPEVKNSSSIFIRYMIKARVRIQKLLKDGYIAESFTCVVNGVHRV